MLNRFAFAALALLFVLSLPSTDASARDQRRVTEFEVHAGDAFILGTFGVPATDIAGASNGDTIELIFTGQINVKRNRAEGDGGVRHFDKKGNLVDFGT